MNTSKMSLIIFILGMAIVAAATHYLTLSMLNDSALRADQSGPPEKNEPLYWVAPMDPNYKRDKPGKSPMGMDLVPVYAEDGDGSDSGPGTIKISPEVVNNLGVRTATVEWQRLHSMIRTVGYVQYDEDRLIHIHPRVKGWIEKLHVKASGDPVTAGQALYELYSPELVNAQEELVLALNRENERLISAAEDRLRALQLSNALISELKNSREVKQNITFYSPQAGVVDNLNIREGFFVQPGTTLMSIGSLADVWVEAEVFERQAALVEVGMPVTMTLEYLPNREWHGQVDYVYPTLDEKTRTLRVRLRFDNADGKLQPNMFAQVVIHADSDADTLIAPREAIIRTGNQDRVVLALGEGRFKSVAVKLGRLDENSVEIVDGLAAGETIVTSAQFLLDSESSKTSDFKRMESTEDQPPKTVWTGATITSVMPDHRMVSVSHEAIPEWEWPSMVMDFTVAEDVPFDQLRDGMSLHIEIANLGDSKYAITNIHIMDNQEAVTKREEAVQRASAEGVINRIDSPGRVLNISRGPIEKWNRSAATMNFVVDDQIDINQFEVNQSIWFSFEIRSGEFVIIDASPAPDEALDPHAGH